MAKVGKLTKLRSAMKRWPSLSKLTRSNSAVSAGEPEDVTAQKQSPQDELYPVYVGKSRRRYLVGGDVICHPLFRELMERSSGGGDGCDREEGEVVVSCEVVMFEHLLWMLENDAGQLGSMEELAEFYIHVDGLTVGT